MTRDPHDPPDEFAPAAPPPASGTPSIEISHRLGFPVRLDHPERERVVMEWCGIPLARPPRLDPVEPGCDVAVVAGFSDRGRPFLRLAHPATRQEADFQLLWLEGEAPDRLAFLTLAGGWPGPEANRVTTARVSDARTLRTLSPEEMLASLGRVQAVMGRWGSLAREAAERVFGAMPDAASAAFRARVGTARELPKRVECPSCEKAIDADVPVCPYCGAARVAPSCPRCGKPVSNVLDARMYHRQENGLYRWHSEWDDRCAACGCEFVARLDVPTGHQPFGGVMAEIEQRQLRGESREQIEAALQQPLGRSRIEVRGGESVHAQCDTWDHQPTLEVRIARTTPANAGDSGLAKETRIVLTAEEWKAITEALAGPLKILLERKAWWRDTT